MVTYQLTDPFLHFCHKIQDKCNYQDEQFWSHSLNTPIYNAWSGFAFEMLCLNHVAQIKEALGISGVQSAVYCWRTPSTAEKGAQIDLVIDRADHCVNLCEMKYCRTEYTMTKAEREKLEHRVDSFISSTGTKSSVRVTLISSHGMLRNANSSIVQSEVTLGDLL